ncbi:MAG: HD domain-containing protein [Deltaproteobacteria bacterium]|nr:HD domain-containing protein [Deltaproteobacteria bacterium]
MIRFSKIIEKNSKEGPKKKATKKEIRLRKTPIFDKDEPGEEKITLRDTSNDTGHYKKLSKLADQVQIWAQNDDVIAISGITSVLRPIIEKNLIDDLYHYLTFQAGEQALLAAHSIKVTLVSLKIGAGMGYDSSGLADLATIAFLHDVGMYQISQGILNKRDTLSDKEFKEVQRHPEISADILSRSNGEYIWLADVALQVHERADGSGYPFGLKQDQIHDYASIIGLADMYSAMISDRPYRERIEQNRAVRDIIDSAQEAFPTKVVKAFLNQISFFPLGSYVKLNDRSVARVTSTHPGFPLKPTIEIIYDSLGSKLQKPRTVDLSQQILLYITGSIDEKDIA